MRTASFLLILLLSALPFAAFGQRTTATIYGAVTDSSNATIAGAAVKAHNEQTGAEATAQTDSIGQFTLTFLPIGSYTITVTMKGFKTFTQSGLALSAGQQLQLPIQMALGSQTESVTVTAEAPIVQNASVSLTDRFSSLQLSELPQTRRDFTQLLPLENGVRSIGSGLFTVNGLAAGGISVTVDGVDASGDPETPSTSMFQGFNYINVVSEEAIQEVTVSKGVMSAEVARSFSGNINVITKGGTNQVHGSLFELFQNDALNARNAMLAPTAVKPPVRYNQFGGSVGGPIKHDRLFYFLTYEGYRQSNFTLENGEVPTADFKAQAIAAVPAYKAQLDLFPLPTNPLPGNNQVGQYFGAVSNTAADNHVVARADWRITDNDLLTLRYIHGRPNNLTPRFPPANPRQFNGKSEEGSFNFIHSSATWSSETRFGYNFSDTTRQEASYVTGTPAINIQGAFNTQAEHLELSGHSYSLEDVIAKNAGRHNIKFGLIYVGRAPGRFDDQVPELRYSNLNDFLANKPNRVTITFGTPGYHGRGWEMGGFFQDDFRVTPRLLLNLGVRYDYYSAFTEENGMLYNPDGVPGALARPVVFRPKDSIFNSDKNNIAPRVGFAYSLDNDSRTVIRSGFGVAYAPWNYREFAGFVFSDPNLPSSFTFSGSDITTYNLTYPTTNQSVSQLLKTQNVPVGYDVFDPNSPNPYSLQWTFDIQRQLTKTMVFQTGYTGNKGLKIGATHDLNGPDPATGIRPYPNDLESTYRTASDYSWYHAWQSSLRKRLSSNLTFNINYTWSKAMALQGGDFWTGDDFKIQDETNWRASRGPTKYDVTHQFVADFVYDFAPSRWIGVQGFWKKLIDGYQINGILTAQTGSVLDIEQSSNRPFSRPDYIGGDALSNGSDRFQYLNPAAFAMVPVGKASGWTLYPGSVGKNSLRGPGQWALNLGIGRNLRFGERYKLQIRADAFNALNHVNLGNPVTDLSKATFGRITGVGAARTVQLNARFTF
ncbi:MAG TPA: TonB-dependent receptor [Bryobacteraceae bacterium]|nr:TonB-dependent receptor [Bryobacteraceae bacterium]